ncbi:TetR/AcrR family transcriptional regulator [Steroidobacter cummioxidans]|uniref:TetR/AcrR family transcriptional regulator n=1 Tax=Steroidobacter cummioxidans TaxID=1803913 RepID=UPI000E3107CE|nr:TetR/AcrR family transcriptional regulator [Steroidobacter cummioxidans]
MPRPKLHSDDAILDAARRVLLRVGIEDFTLQAVAVEVGISRAALIQRFNNRDTLLRHVALRHTEVTRQGLEGMDCEPGVQGLWRFLCTLVCGMGSGEGIANRLPLILQETRDPEVKRLANERYRLVQHAIAIRLPPDIKSRDDWGVALQGAIAGATMQWLYDDHLPLDQYVLQRLKFTMERLFPGETFRLPRPPADRK